MKDALMNIGGVLYIHPIRFLQILQSRVRTLEERIAVPGVDYATTEALRGRRTEMITLIQQLTELTNGHR